MQDFNQRRRDFDTRFAAMERTGKRMARVLFVVYGAFVLLLLTIGVLVAYGLARWVGLL